MAQTFCVPNFPDSNIVQRTSLKADATAGSTQLTADNNAGFSSGDFFILGPLTSETSELLAVGTTSSSEGITTLSNLSFDHKAQEDITKLFGSQLRIYRAPNIDGLPPSKSVFSLLDTVPIQVDMAETEYTDNAGSGDYWYAYTFYNPTTSSETDFDSSDAVRGGSFGNYCSLADIREEAGFLHAPYVTDWAIDAKRQAAQAEINGTLKGSFTVPFTPPINPHIADICRRLAAGLLLVEQYGQIRSASSINGQDRIDRARADLKAVASGDVTLLDQAGNDVALPDATGSVSGWPNETTAYLPPQMGGDHGVQFKVDMEY